MIDALRKSKPSFVMGAVTWLEDEFMEDPDGPLTFQAFEWGYGGSTVWLSQRAARTVTVEHHPEWFAEAIKTLEGWEISESVDLVLVPLANGYTEYIQKFDDGAFDLVFIDGRQRADCLKAAKDKIRPGGVLVLDDSQRSQYQEAMKELAGWERMDFDSGWSNGWRTTVWRRPGDMGVCQHPQTP